MVQRQEGGKRRVSGSAFNELEGRAVVSQQTQIGRSEFFASPPSASPPPTLAPAAVTRLPFGSAAVDPSLAQPSFAARRNPAIRTLPLINKTLEHHRAQDSANTHMLPPSCSRSRVQPTPASPAAPQIELAVHVVRAAVVGLRRRRCFPAACRPPVEPAFSRALVQTSF